MDSCDQCSCCGRLGSNFIKCLLQIALIPSRDRSVMFLFYSLLIISISAYEDHTSIINIHEELPPNTLLLPSISTSPALQWLPSSYSFQSYFRLDANQSLYTTNLVIDREEFCEKRLCNCSDCTISLNFLQPFSPNNISIRTIQLTIEDINDHSPTFKQAAIQLSVAENVPIGYEIPLESAVDNDYGLLSVQQYELYPKENNPFRLIKSSKPILKLNEALDRERTANYLLKLVAYDGGQPALSGEQSIEVLITDVNDNAPTFEQMIYQKSLPENYPVDSTILKIHASDRDEDANGRITYHIDDRSATFGIDRQTGEVSLQQPLDYEKTRSYSLTITAHDNGVPQLTNYATLLIDVTDVNDHTPDVLLTQVNGTKMNNQPINLPECTLKDTPLLYIYITDEDSGDNGRVTCTLNDTRLSLSYLTTNAYSLQTSHSSSFDYEQEHAAVVHLQCADFGRPALSASTLLHLSIEDCNDNAPEIISPSNQSLSVPYETTDLPFILTQFVVVDRDRSQSNVFSYSFTVSPPLNLSLINNGTLILRSLPDTPGTFTVNVTVHDSGNLTSTIAIPIHVHLINETSLATRFSMENTSLVLCITFFIIVFLAAILIAVCFLLAFLLRRRERKLPSQSTHQSSSNGSTTSSHERAGSSQKTTIEIFDEGTNSSNRVYQYGIQQAAVDRKAIDPSGADQSDFDYSEKVQRYLTHLNNRLIAGTDLDEGVYGSSDVSSERLQQLIIRPASITSLHSSQQTYQDSFKRFEQLYALVERQPVTNLDTSGFTSDSLYV